MIFFYYIQTQTIAVLHTFIVHRPPSTLHRLRSAVQSAVCGPRSAVCF